MKKYLLKNLAHHVRFSCFSSMAIALFFVGLGILCFTHSASAYLTQLQSGESLGTNQYRIGFIPQLVTNDSAGVNFDTALDAGWNDSMSSRFYIGGGKMDLHLGGNFQWVPFPDVDKQPAIGVRAGTWYARYKDENYLTFSIAPLVSKKIEHRGEILTPYVAAPINYTFNKTKDYYSQQFVIGSEWIHPQIKKWSFAAEIGLNLKDTYSFVAIYAGFQFDGLQGVK